MGCIFAELLARQPLFPGNDYIDQLRLICSKLGSCALSHTTPVPHATHTDVLCSDMHAGMSRISHAAAPTSLASSPTHVPLPHTPTPHPPPPPPPPGRPSEADLHFVASARARRFILSLPPTPRQPMHLHFPGQDPKALDLLDRMLQFNPAARPSAEEVGRFWVTEWRESRKECVCVCVGGIGAHPAFLCGCLVWRHAGRLCPFFLSFPPPLPPPLFNHTTRAYAAPHPVVLSLSHAAHHGFARPHHHQHDAQALEHPFMESLHSADDEPSCMGSDRAPFSFDFEQEPLDRRRLQVMRFCGLWGGRVDDDDAWLKN